MKFLNTFVFVLSLSVSAFAWIPQMFFSTSTHQVQVQVYNPTGYVAFCQGYVFGHVQNGAVMNSWFSSYIPAGGYAYAYLYATPPYYLTNAWAEIHCQ